jgi:hypothetical protein
MIAGPISSEMRFTASCRGFQRGQRNEAQPQQRRHLHHDLDDAADEHAGREHQHRLREMR